MSLCFYPVPLPPCWILPNVLSLSFLSLSEMLFIICIRNWCAILKDWISLVSVHVSAPARQTCSVFSQEIYNMNLTYFWSSGDYTPHNTGIFRAYLKVMLTLLIDLTASNLLGPSIWTETQQNLMLSTKFQSEVWVFVQNRISKWVSE